jgi:acetyltransferase-like isoleucine patch superfamily enzyme
MRKIGPAAITVFLALLALILALAIGSAWLAGQAAAGLGAFLPIFQCVLAIALVYIYGMAIHRFFLALTPLHSGAIEAASRQEFTYHVYVLFYLILFNTLIRSGALPIPVMRLVYQGLGARLGPNTYSSGIIYDPLFVSMGANSVVGESALLIPHVIEGERLGHFPIAIGDNVTIGAHAIVLAGVTIGNNAIVAANSLVTKGTRIDNGEVWGGNPARRLR